MLAVDPARPAVDVVADVPAPLVHALPLGHRVLLVARPGAGPGPLLLDPARGTVRPAATPSAGPATPLATAAGRVLYGVRTPHGHRLALLDPDDPDGPGTVFAVSASGGIDGPSLPLALSPDLSEVVLRVTRGARSALVAYPVGGGDARWLDLPAGRTAPTAGWGDRGLWLPHSTPDRPTTWWWRPPGAQGLRPATGSRLPCPPVDVATLPGAAGPVEAVVYGADWATSDRVVVALHGGPADHWDLGYDDVLRRLATAGLTVVAVNPRGSSGYGRDFEYAIDGAWGGPDLADVLAVADHLRLVRGDHRPPPALYGVSYGAYLALRALAHRPGAWSACVAVAPFLSGARLRADAGPRVRALIDRLHGAAEPDDGYGPRDLLQVVHRMRGRVLLVHGSDDAVIPVSHSRALAGALESVPGVDVTYREVRGADHQVLRSDPSLVAEVCAVLTGAGGAAAAAGSGTSGPHVVRAGSTRARLVTPSGTSGGRR